MYPPSFFGSFLAGLCSRIDTGDCDGDQQQDLSQGAEGIAPCEATGLTQEHATGSGTGFTPPAVGGGGRQSPPQASLLPRARRLVVRGRWVIYLEIVRLYTESFGELQDRPPSRGSVATFKPGNVLVQHPHAFRQLLLR